MTLIILFGVGLFAVFTLCFVLLFRGSSSQAALLEQVARSARGTGPVAGPWRPSLNSDLLAKPFTVFRRFFSNEPDPEVLRLLTLAGYRKPPIADIFLGMRLAVTATLRLS